MGPGSLATPGRFFSYNNEMERIKKNGQDPFLRGPIPDVMTFSA